MHQLVFIYLLGSMISANPALSSTNTARVVWLAHAQRIARTSYETNLVIELVVAGTLVGALGLLPLGLGFVLVKSAGVAAFVGFLALRGLLPLSMLRSTLAAGES